MSALSLLLAGEWNPTLAMKSVKKADARSSAIHPNVIRPKIARVKLQHEEKNSKVVKKIAGVIARAERRIAELSANLTQKTQEKESLTARRAAILRRLTKRKASPQSKRELRASANDIKNLIEVLNLDIEALNTKIDAEQSMVRKSIKRKQEISERALSNMEIAQKVYAQNKDGLIERANKIVKQVRKKDRSRIFFSQGSAGEGTLIAYSIGRLQNGDKIIEKYKSNHAKLEKNRFNLSGAEYRQQLNRLMRKTAEKMEPLYQEIVSLSKKDQEDNFLREWSPWRVTVRIDGFIERIPTDVREQNLEYRMQKLAKEFEEVIRYASSETASAEHALVALISRRYLPEAK